MFLNWDWRVILKLSKRRAREPFIPLWKCFPLGKWAFIPVPRPLISVMASRLFEHLHPILSLAVNWVPDDQNSVRVELPAWKQVQSALRIAWQIEIWENLFTISYLKTSFIIIMGSCVEEREMEEILAIQKREENLMKLIQETGCEIVQENGQRKFGGPPPSKLFVDIVQFVCFF